LKTSAGFKQKLGELNGKVSQIAAEKKALEAKVAELEGQNSSLQTASSTVRPETASGDPENQTSVIVSRFFAEGLLLTIFSNFQDGFARGERQTPCRESILDQAIREHGAII
jgi:hypothetical protein